jgi:hypothetical protein
MTAHKSKSGSPRYSWLSSSLLNDFLEGVCEAMNAYRDLLRRLWMTEPSPRGHFAPVSRHRAPLGWSTAETEVSVGDRRHSLGERTAVQEVVEQTLVAAMTPESPLEATETVWAAVATIPEAA